ncbi:MAG: glycosyltransferase family 4 protein [Gemmatimonadota bacterium]
MADDKKPFSALRVALLTSARTWRGSCVSLASLARGLVNRGHKAVLLVGEASIAEAAADYGIPVVVLPTRNTGLTEIQALRRVLVERDIQILIADRPRDHRLGAMASVGRKTALVYRYNVSRPRPPSDLVTRLALRRTAMTVFRTATGAAQVLARAPFMNRRPHAVITGGIDTAAYYPDAEAGEEFRRTYSLGEKPFLLAVGALVPEKRYPEMFASVAALSPRIPLVICGVGRQEQELRELASRLEIEVRLLGLLSGARLRGAYAATAMLIHTCVVETFGLSVAEAMACGCPVIVVGGGAMTEVVGTAGVVVSSDRPDAFTAAIEDMMQNPEKRFLLGLAAKARSQACFSLEQVVDNYERLLVELGA